jgi:hypothetical protein
MHALLPSSLMQGLQFTERPLTKFQRGTTYVTVPYLLPKISVVVHPPFSEITRWATIWEESCFFFSDSNKTWCKQHLMSTASTIGSHKRRAFSIYLSEFYFLSFDNDNRLTRADCDLARFSTMCVQLEETTGGNNCAGSRLEGRRGDVCQAASLFWVVVDLWWTATVARASRGWAAPAGIGGGCSNLIALFYS